MLRCCQCYGWTVEVRSKLLALQKRNGGPLFRYATLILSASPSQQISVHGVARMAPVCREDSLADEAAQDGDLERNAAFDGKPIQITKEINIVLLTCGYIADNSNKLVLDYLQLVERLLSFTI